MIFTVYGKPVSQGSLTAVPTNRNWRTIPGVRWTIKDAKPDLKAWRETVADAARRSPGARLFEGPVRVWVRFSMERPASHFFRRKGGDVLRPDAPHWVTSHQLGDLDKHLRSILDALTGVLFEDDSQVAYVSATKTYAKNPLTTIEVIPIRDLRSSPPYEGVTPSGASD